MKQIQRKIDSGELVNKPVAITDEEHAWMMLTVSGELDRLRDLRPMVQRTRLRKMLKGLQRKLWKL